MVAPSPPGFQSRGHRPWCAIRCATSSSSSPTATIATKPQWPTAMNGDPQLEIALVPQPRREPAPYELVMMTFINMDSPGLAILPTHRVVHGLESFSADRASRPRPVLLQHRGSGPIHRFPPRPWIILREPGHAGTALLGVTADRAFLFDTSQKPSATKHCSTASPFASNRWMSSSYTNACWKACWKFPTKPFASKRTSATFAMPPRPWRAYVTGSANVAFLMNPVRMKQVRDIAFGGEVLPQKSTEFYPKLLSGLTIYALE